MKNNQGSIKPVKEAMAVGVVSPASSGEEQWILKEVVRPECSHSVG